MVCKQIKERVLMKLGADNKLTMCIIRENALQMAMFKMLCEQEESLMFRYDRHRCNCRGCWC